MGARRQIINESFGPRPVPSFAQQAVIEHHRRVHQLGDGPNGLCSGHWVA